MHKHHSCHQQSCCSGKGCCSESSKGCSCSCHSCCCGSKSHSPQACSCSCHHESSHNSCCQGGSCSSKSCHEQTHHHHHHGHGECCSHDGHILCLVKSLKHKLLKEKILRHLEDKMGKKLDELAAVAVDAFLAEREQHINAKKTCCSFRDKISDIFKE